MSVGCCPSLLGGMENRSRLPTGRRKRLGGVGGHPPDANQRKTRPTRVAEGGTDRETENDHTDTRGGADAGGDGRGRWCRRRRQGGKLQAQEHTLFGAQIERGDYGAGSSLQTPEVVPTGTDGGVCRLLLAEEPKRTGSHGQAQKDGRSIPHSERKTSEATTEQAGGCNDGGRAVRHGRRSLQPPACGGAKAHRELRTSAKGRQEHISVSAASASAASQHTDKRTGWAVRL